MCPINVGIVRQFYHIIDVLVPCSGLQWATRPSSESLFLALPDGFVVKVLVANPILLYCVSYHGEKCSNQGERSYPLGPALRIEKCSNQGSRSYPFGGNLGPALHIALIMFLFREIKDRFLDRIRGACNARGRSLRGPLDIRNWSIPYINVNSEKVILPPSHTKGVGYPFSKSRGKSAFLNVSACELKSMKIWASNPKNSWR